MRRNNRTAAKVFTFMLCLALLTGCSDTGKNDNNPTSEPDSTVTATEQPGQTTGTETGDKDSDKQDPDTGKVDDGAGKNEVENTPTPDSGDSENKSDASNVDVPAPAAFKIISIDYKTKDLETSYVPGDCTSIVFSDNDIKVVGKETEISSVNGRQTVKIIKKGDYLISGSCSNGQIIVEANKEKDVRLILNGLTLSCSDSAPIYEQQCDKMVITLADGTENILSSDSEYIYDNVEKKQPDAVIFAKDDLVINGNGKLTVDSSYMEGIHSTDSVKLISGNITVNSGDTGVRGKEAVIIKEADINVMSRGDGIKTTYSDNTSLGYVVIEGGNITISAGGDGIHADNELTINDGSIDITKSKEGIEGSAVTINGGNVYVYATDDGINACGTTSTDSGFGGKGFGGMGGMGYVSDAKITVNGGNIFVKTSSGDTDGIDSNGDFEQTGGYLVVAAGAGAGSVCGSVDVNGSITISGGSTVALGGICELPENSVNTYVLNGVSLAAGEYVLKDADGDEILSFETDSTYSAG